MRYVATLLALFVVATAAAGQEWREAASEEPEPIELRPSEPPAETKATLLDLKGRPALPAPETNGSKTNGLATKVAARRPPAPAVKPSPRAPVTPPAQAPRRPTLGAPAAPAPKPVAIAAAATRNDDRDDDDDDDDDEGGDDDD